MACFGAVIKAEGATARFAAERKEVELVAVGVLAVGADERGVFFVHACEARFAFGGIGISCGGRHSGGRGTEIVIVTAE